MSNFQPYGQNFDQNPQKNSTYDEKSEIDASHTDTPNSPYHPPFYTGPAFSCSPAYTQKPKPAFLGLDTLFAWLSIVVGVLFVRTLPIVQNTLGGVLLTWLLFAFGAIYLVRSKVKLNTSAICFAITVCVLSLGLITGANKALQRWLFLFILFAFLYFIYYVCGLSGKKMFGDHFLSHAGRGIFVVPLTSLSYLFRALPIRRKNNGSGKLLRTVGWVLLGLAIAIVPTAIVITLLSYDEQFMSLLDKMFSFSLDGVGEYLLDAIFGFVTAIVLFGALFGVKWQRQLNNGEEIKNATVNCHVLPKALLCAAVTPVLVVYVIFFISQWDYYISAFTHRLPGELTYAAYARSGFFELCGVCTLNAVMLLLFHLLMRRKEGERGILQKIYSTLISVFTLVLIATAISKMALYISSYGLTQKRVYASWLMLLLAALFVLVLLRQFVPRLRSAAPIVICCIAFIALLVLPDIDGMIASYNVEAYLSDKLSDADVETIADYGVSSVPALVDLEEALASRTTLTEEEANILQRTAEVLEKLEQEIEARPDNFFTFHIPTARARAALKQRNK